MKTFIPALILMTIVAIAAECNAVEPAAGKMVKVFPKNAGLLPYWLYLPRDFKSTKNRVPVVMFLHGMGERGNNLDPVSKHGPAKLIARSGKHFPFIMIAPQCPNDGHYKDKNKNAKQFWWMPGTIDKVKSILDHEKRRLKRVDDDRVYITGLSMGGFGCYNIVNRHPNVFAAAAPICGHGNSWPDKKAVAHIPFWAFHGGNDRVVKLATQQKTVDALKTAGASVKFTIYPDAGHDSWSRTYANPKLYEWLLAQKRKPSKQAK